MRTFMIVAGGIVLAVNFYLAIAVLSHVEQINLLKPRPRGSGERSTAYWLSCVAAGLLLIPVIITLSLVRFIGFRSRVLYNKFIRRSGDVSP